MMENDSEDRTQRLDRMIKYLSVLQYLQDNDQQPSEIELRDYLFVPAIIRAENALEGNLDLQHFGGPTSLCKHVNEQDGYFHTLAHVHMDGNHASHVSIRGKGGCVSMLNFDPLPISDPEVRKSILAFRGVDKNIPGAKGATFPLDAIRAPLTCNVTSIAIGEKLRDHPDLLNALHDDLESGELRKRASAGEFSVSNLFLSSLDKLIAHQTEQRFSVLSPDDTIPTALLLPLLINATSPKRLEALYEKHPDARTMILREGKATQTTVPEIQQRFERGSYSTKSEEKRRYYFKRAIQYYLDNPEVDIPTLDLESVPSKDIQEKQQTFDEHYESFKSFFERRPAQKYLQDAWSSHQTRGHLRREDIGDVSRHLAKDDDLQQCLKEHGAAFVRFGAHTSTGWENVASNSLTGQTNLSSDGDYVILRHPSGIGIFRSQDVRVDSRKDANAMIFERNGKGFQGRAIVHDVQGRPLGR